MNASHRTIREMLRRMPVNEAENILRRVLPPKEFAAIYHSDIMQNSLLELEERLGYSESNIKKIRRSGYAKLASSFVTKGEPRSS